MLRPGTGVSGSYMQGKHSCGLSNKYTLICAKSIDRQERQLSWSHQKETVTGKDTLFSNQWVYPIPSCKNTIIDKTMVDISHVEFVINM